MQATFYSFKKKKNSTKQPTGGTALNIKLLDNVSVITPRFHLMGNIETFTYNYVKWNGRYYWISDKISITTTTLEIGCTKDPLASWKSDIGSSEQYVLRSASEWDGNITDMLYPTKITRKLLYSARHDVFDHINGFFVLGFIVDPVSNYGRGTVSYFPMTRADLTATLARFSSGAEIFGTNPMNFITSCTYIPLPVATYLVSTATNITVKLGAVMSLQITFHDYAALYIDASHQILEWNTIVEIPKHPLASTRGEYLNASPYMEYKLIAGPFGEVRIPPELCIGITDTTLRFRIDLVTGSGSMSIMEPTQGGMDMRIKFSSFCQLGTQVQLTSLIGPTVQQLASVIPGLISMGTGIATGRPQEAISGMNSAILSSLDAMKPTVYSHGTNGTFVDYVEDVYVEAQYVEPVEDYKIDRGRPLCKVKTINSLSGFIMCSQASIELTATDTEIAEIVNYMNQGFFYE